jgi:uncharacterized membrane protein
MGAEIVNQIISIFGESAGKIIGVFFISLLPIIELRGAVPVAYALGLPWQTAFICAGIGNLLPVPFILLFIEAIFRFMRKHGIITNFLDKIERKAQSKSDGVEKFKFWGLAIFVGLPLPGTGGWTGALIASVIRMNKLKAFVSIFIGVLLADTIVTAFMYGLLDVIIGVFK